MGEARPKRRKRERCQNGHQMTEQNTGVRGTCLTCRRDYQRHYMRRYRAKAELGAADMRDSISERGCG